MSMFQMNEWVHSLTFISAKLKILMTHILCLPVFLVNEPNAFRSKFIIASNYAVELLGDLVKSMGEVNSKCYCFLSSFAIVFH